MEGGLWVRQCSSLIMKPASVYIVVKYLAKPLKIHYLQIITCRWGGLRGVGGVETRLVGSGMRTEGQLCLTVKTSQHPLAFVFADGV